MDSIEARLRALGVALPPPPAAVAVYVPAVVEGALCFTAGQLPMADGRLMSPGIVGQDVSVEEAKAAARQAALNALAAAAAAAGGLERIAGVVKVVGFVQSASGFHGQPAVLNGASELFENIFGAAGRHARSAVGVNALPLNAPVEVECVFRLQD